MSVYNNNNFSDFNTNQYSNFELNFGILNSLPNEVILKIFTYFNDKTLQSSVSVNKSFEILTLEAAKLPLINIINQLIKGTDQHPQIEEIFTSLKGEVNKISNLKNLKNCEKKIIAKVADITYSLIETKLFDDTQKDDLLKQICEILLKYGNDDEVLKLSGLFSFRTSYGYKIANEILMNIIEKNGVKNPNGYQIALSKCDHIQDMIKKSIFVRNIISKGYEEMSD
ncbi:MAG: hypothetical protein Tsb0021_16350 [Chlamydiales bacterium]